MSLVSTTSADVISRRQALRTGAAVLGALSLPQLLARTLVADTGARPKSVVMIHLSGGPSHLDMYDMKPAAPREYRGEFNAIATNVPGIEICELMPRQAQIADKFAILRGVQMIYPLHSGNEFYSGHPYQEGLKLNFPGEAKRPSMGAIVSRARGSRDGMPPYVSIENSAHWEGAYFAGAEHEPFRIGGGSHDLIQNMGRRPDVDGPRLASRSDLLQALDLPRRGGVTNVAAIDACRGRALEILMSDRVRDAFDLEKEPEEMRRRYGNEPYSLGPHPGHSLLRARRLIEAGASVVTVGVHNWDTHQNNFNQLRKQLPPLDQALHALITDLDERGRLGDVAVIMGGEFGRTPKVGDQTPDGRGHWPEAGFMWMAGGGLKTGQTLGATDARGEQVTGKPIRMQNVLATLYRLLGVDPAQTLTDYNGRPQFVLDQRDPIVELL